MEKFTKTDNNELYGFNFGLNNNFKELTEEESKKVNLLFEERAKLIEDYKRISSLLKPLLEEYTSISRDLSMDNYLICKMEGHRLSEEVHGSHENDEYGIYDRFAYRTCLVCGKKVYDHEINDNDVVVKEESEPFELVLKNYKISKL